MTQTVIARCGQRVEIQTDAVRGMHIVRFLKDEDKGASRTVVMTTAQCWSKLGVVPRGAVSSQKTYNN